MESADDRNKLAYQILFEKQVKIGQKKLHMMLHTKRGNYNSKTSICVSSLNYLCTEQHIVEELNLVLRDERQKNQPAEQNPETEAKKKHFILSCIVFVDPMTRQSKQFAFVDFDSEDAAKICKEAWNENRMAKFPNKLSVAVYDQSHVKLTKEQQRERTKERQQQFTNLYVEKLPYAYTQKDVFELFSKYGTVLDVKMKKPTSNVQLQSIHSLPCAAYVNFKDQTQADAAVAALNGKAVLPGANQLRIDYYQRANKFLGGLLGLDRNELIQNTHWRVLFIKGIRRSVSNPPES